MLFVLTPHNDFYGDACLQVEEPSEEDVEEEVEEEEVEQEEELDAEVPDTEDAEIPAEESTDEVRTLHFSNNTENLLFFDARKVDTCTRWCIAEDG